MSAKICFDGFREVSASEVLRVDLSDLFAMEEAEARKDVGKYLDRIRKRVADRIGFDTDFKLFWRDSDNWIVCENDDDVWAMAHFVSSNRLRDWPPAKKPTSIRFKVQPGRSVEAKVYMQEHWEDQGELLNAWAAPDAVFKCKLALH